jgi:CRISPR-associated protein Csb2
MALIMKIALPLGRYSATPWGHHVNEGMVEWPPSPWRIVRALTASWHVHHQGLATDDVRSALELLCSAPRYRLPRHGTSVTRHYLPDAADRSAKRSTSLALDASYVVTPGDAIEAEWDVSPSDAQLETLGRLASAVSYLGRAGSRVAIEVAVGGSSNEGVLKPSDGSGISDDEVLDLLVPSIPLDLDAIVVTTGSLHKNGHTVPPASRWVTYEVPREERMTVPRLDRPTGAMVEAIQFSVSGRGRPTMSNAALLAALFRRAVTSRAKDDETLHGHDGAAEDNHKHAHFLVLNDLEKGSRVDRLVVWSPDGIAPESVSRIAGMSSLFVPDYLSKRLGSSVDLALEYVGSAEGLGRPLVGPARTWRSLTPVTTPRHRKRNQTWEQFVETTVRRELEHHGLPVESTRVSVILDQEVEPAGLGARVVYRSRSLGRDRQQTGFHVTVEFEEPIGGPLTLGALSHFGLGTFVVARE